MKPIYIILLLFCLPLRFTMGQMLNTDSLKRLLEKKQPDTSRVLLLVQMANFYRFNQPDSAIILAKKAIQLAKRLPFAMGEERAFNVIGEALRIQGELPQALETQFSALRISRNIHYRVGEANSLAYIGNIYVEMSEYQQWLHYLRQAIHIYAFHSGENIDRMRSFTLSNMGNAYEKMHLLDSALFYQKQAHALSRKVNRGPIQSLILNRLGIVQTRLGNTTQALSYHRNALKNANNTNDKLNQSRALYRIAEIYHQRHQVDSSLYYARLAFYNSQRILQKASVLDASSLLVKLYWAQNNLDSAFHYQQIAMTAKDNLFGPEKFQRLQLLTLREQKRLQQLREEQARSEAKFQRIILIAVLGVILLIALMLWRHNRKQLHANQSLHQKNEQIESQRNALERTLTELKATQAQLIQSEKMASLGELTAGIAHEIQNPLNYVNNFSEVSEELCEELSEELQAGHTNKSVTIATDIKENLQKIKQHGQRADAIVKNMMQHSRTSSSQKEPTDINALADEYLRLAYYGLRAKDKSFNANLITDFDNNIGKAEVVPQEIGRVLLNLFNNAFYATQQKKAQLNNQYQPEVRITTKLLDRKVEIKVRDNGNGIPDKVKDKIFQPFFTTKPTGQGTGLGLSLSYDIITKSHSGELKVETKEGEGSEFIVLLPIA